MACASIKLQRAVRRVPGMLATLAMLAMLMLSPHAHAAAPLLLGADTAQVDAWPAVTILPDPGRKLTPEAALAARAQFTVPQSAYATLGVHKEPMWLRIPVHQAAGSDGAWIVDVNFAVINHIDIYITSAGIVLDHYRTGNLEPQAADAQPARVPATAIHLAPGADYEVLLRVENIGAMILPIRFSRAATFQGRALNEQMLQGMLTGLSICLLLYSLAQWINLKEPLFASYALLVAGSFLFSFEFFGLGAQYIWHNNAWMSIHSGGLFALMASCGAYLFVQQALARPGMDRTFTRLMRGGALLCVVSAAAFAADLFSVDILVAIVSTLGLLPMLFGLPGAYHRARRGDVVGIYFLCGWAVSFASSVILSRVIASEIGANFWSMHVLQFGHVIDQLVFMRILGLRTKAIQTAMLRAEASTRMKSDFLANMSHEIRTPMNAIIGMSRLALMAEPNPRLRNYLSKIQGAGEHLLGIINDILDFSRIEAGKLTLEAVPFDLNEMLEHLASLTAIKTDAKRVELVFRVGAGVPARLVGDPLRLGQILINLTGNAVKFTEQGEIVVAVKLLEQLDGQVALRFSVSDTGIGMNQDQLKRLFDSFTQADGSITRKYGGTGLGLSITRQLVELMGGAIQVSSTPGVGSRFSFTIKLGVGSDDAVALSSPAALLHQVRVMVVDDSATARDALVEMLGSFGVTAHAASSGEQSLTMLAKAEEAGEPYQVLLMDYMMPGWDGVETIRRLHADPRLSAPPAILMVSVCTRDTVVQQEGAVPLQGFLTKPVGPALLYHSLLQALQPDADEAAASPSGAAPVAALRMSELAALAGARVLLVDDNANNREVALDFLSTIRIQVDLATNGREAVQMALANDYDLVLMDIQMRDMDGLSATRQIRADGRHPDLPIIAMTAYAMAGDREKSLAAGMNDHVTKPIDPDLLFGALLKWIAPARLAGRVQGHASPAAAAPAAPAATVAATAAATAPEALPATPGIDWQMALASVDGQQARLQRRVRGFVEEYRNMPQTARNAIASGQSELLQSLAHNLKSSATYVGATTLATLAHQLEQALRDGQQAPISRLTLELLAQLELVLAGLAPVAAPMAAPAAHAVLATLLRQLHAYLRSDDARAEDVLQELRAALPGEAHAGPLNALAHAVGEIEYEVALAALDELAQALQITLEEENA